MYLNPEFIENEFYNGSKEVKLDNNNMLNFKSVWENYIEHIDELEKKFEKCLEDYPRENLTKFEI